MRNIIKLGIFLLLISGLAGLGIGYVNGLTQPLIAEQAETNKLNSLKEVYPQAEQIKDETEKYISDSSNPIIREVNIAYVQGAPVGVIYTVEPKGYSSVVKTLVGFDIAAKKITAVKVISQSETPSLGSRSVENFFSDRFKGKMANEPVVIVKREPIQGNQVLAITAATVTSKAVASGVNAARENFVKNFTK